jgi:hypothetical protein
VEVKIGIKGTPRELVVETEVGAEDVTTALKAALADNGIFTLADEKGRQVLVPADKLAYVEIGAPETRRVGFGAM